MGSKRSVTAENIWLSRKYFGLTVWVDIRYIHRLSLGRIYRVETTSNKPRLKIEVTKTQSGGKSFTYNSWLHKFIKLHLPTGTGLTHKGKGYYGD